MTHARVPHGLCRYICVCHASMCCGTANTFLQWLPLLGRKSKTNHPIQSEGEIYCENKQSTPACWFNAFVDTIAEKTLSPAKNQYGLPLRLSLKYSMKTIIKSKLNYYINTLGTESAFFRGYSCEKAVSKWVIQRNVRQTQHKTNCQSNAVFQSTTDSSKKLQSVIIAHRPPWTFKLKFNRPVTINDAYVQTEIFQSRSLKVPGFPWGRRADRCRAWWEQYDITRVGGDRSESHHLSLATEHFENHNILTGRSCGKLSDGLWWEARLPLGRDPALCGAACSLTLLSADWWLFSSL